MSEAIELGWANAHVTATELVTVGKEGNEQEVINIEVTFPDFRDQKLNGNFFFTEKSMDMTFDVLEACGWSPEQNDWNLTLIDKGKETPCAGTVVRVEVTENERDGKYYKSLNRITKPGSRKKASEDGMKSLMARIKGHHRDPGRFDRKSSGSGPAPTIAVNKEDTPY